ncbi:NAD(+) kinase [Spiroplasma endosymbiont of Amphibalanus improvisus]|uniref:NAD(+) kinase n=1 Tax=Spiroplasma endosymbiont of Amphibalanus improvisus TaxID=3066327 RepID=UPI00313DFA9D
MKYNIVSNDYKESSELKNKLQKALDENKIFELSNDNPQVVFIIGGDGTFLKTINKFQHLLFNDDFYLVPIKAGSLNFYSTFNETNFLESLNLLKNIQNEFIDKLSLLEVELPDKTRYAINEIKVIDHVKTLSTKIFVNDELIENFTGSGIVMATKTGSTGYIKSIQGSIILSELELWEIAEIAPLSNAVFSTINSPIIMDKNQIISLEGKLKGKSIIIDTFEYKLEVDKLQIKIAEKYLKVLVNPDNRMTITCRLKKTLTHNLKK